MTVAVLPASFDPITCGHVDIAARAAKLFERLVVAVFARPKKKVLFSLEDRVEMVRESLKGVDGVEVTSFEGLLVDFARRIGASVEVRGLRAVSDFEYEYQQAALNRQMYPGFEVLSLFPSTEYAFLSSSIVKEIAEHGGDVSHMVPAPVAQRLAEKFSGQAAPGR
jgi:pantetheine-phosphate adenylyltransferase